MSVYILSAISPSLVSFSANTFTFPKNSVVKFVIEKPYYLSLNFALFVNTDRLVFIGCIT